MKRILVTGATGNVGHQVIRYFSQIETKNIIVAGVRDIDKAKNQLTGFSNLEFSVFDFERTDSFEQSLENIDRIFILRPPHISDTDKYFRPLVSVIKEKKTDVVFLSVQGAEKSKIIPHNRIEKLIKDSGVNYIFLRPSYFMQNLTTILRNDIQDKRMIILPSGKGKFNWIDIENIGEISAIILNSFEQYKNQEIEITGSENKNFYEVTELINQFLDDKIEFFSLNPLKFYKIKKQDGLEKGMIIVMIMLHFLPRFQKEPLISDFYTKLTGKKPNTLKEFIEREFRQFKIKDKLLH